VAFNGTAYNMAGLQNLPVEPVHFWRLPSEFPQGLPAMPPHPIRIPLP
jgi:hypothetical protein